VDLFLAVYDYVEQEKKFPTASPMGEKNMENNAITILWEHGPTCLFFRVTGSLRCSSK